MSAFVMRDASTLFEATERKGELTRAELVPSTEMQQLKTLDPQTVHSDIDAASWTFEIAGVQDWVVSQGLADFLHTNHGLQVSVTLQPKPGTGQRVADFVVIAQSPNFGGTQGQWALIELSLPVVDVPTFSASV